MSLTQVNSAGIADGAIVNADVNNSAAVALSKLSTSGTASSSTFLRGDGAWTAIDLANLSASNLTSGTVPDARFPATLPALSGTALTNLNASNISSGTLAAARLPASYAVLSGSTDNQIATVTGANALQGESVLTFDGNDLQVRPAKANLIVAKAGLTVKANSDLHTSYDLIQLGAGGALASYSTATATADTQFIHNAYRSSGGSWKYRYADTAARLRVNSPARTWVFESAASGSADGDITFTEQLRITSTGQLQATSAADVRLTLGSSGTAGTNDSVHIRADSADLKFMAASGGTTLFESNGNETFRITSGGNLGVNCDSPTSLTNSRGITLQGSGGTAAGFINFMDSADNSDGRILADDGQLYIHADISDNTADSLIIFNVDSSEKARINYNGNFTVQRYTVASENTSGDFKITVSGLTNNAGSNWRKCGVFVIYNGINTDATSSRSAVGYYGVGGLTNWSWLGTNEDDVFTADTLPVTLDNATTTSFRLNFNVADGNTGSVTVFVNAWNVRPIVSIAG